MYLPKISVITPSYNQGKFIEETICSIVEQNYPNLEFILIDGESKDESVNIIKQYDKRISYWISERDNGQSNAINKGLQKAIGEILTWINSDDLLLPGSLHKVGELFTSLSANTGVIHGGTMLFDNNNDIKEVYSYGKPSIEKYLSGMAFSQPSAFFRKSFLDKVGLLREDLHYGMDYDLFARLACVCSFKPIEIMFSKYRLHDESKSVAHSEKFRNDWNRVFISVCSHLGWFELIEELYRFVPELKKSNSLLEYSFVPDLKLLNSVNRKKVLFYFLCDLLLHYYWYDKREDARILLQKMENAFDKNWFKEENRVWSVIRKLKVPESILRSLKTLKRHFRKR